MPFTTNDDAILKKRYNQLLQERPILENIVTEPNEYKANNFDDFKSAFICKNIKPIQKHIKNILWNRHDDLSFQAFIEKIFSDSGETVDEFLRKANLPDAARRINQANTYANPSLLQKTISLLMPKGARLSEQKIDKLFAVEGVEKLQKTFVNLSNKIVKVSDQRRAFFNLLRSEFDNKSSCMECLEELEKILSLEESVEANSTKSKAIYNDPNYRILRCPPLVEH